MLDQTGEPVIIEKTVTKVTKTTRYISNNNTNGSMEMSSSQKKTNIETSTNKGRVADGDHSPHWAENSSNYEIEVRAVVG